jgi:hypothetical protein
VAKESKNGNGNGAESPVRELADWQRQLLESGDFRISNSTFAELASADQDWIKAKAKEKRKKLVLPKSMG